MNIRIIAKCTNNKNLAFQSGCSSFSATLYMYIHFAHKYSFTSSKNPNIRANTHTQYVYVCIKCSCFNKRGVNDSWFFVVALLQQTQTSSVVKQLKQTALKWCLIDIQCIKMYTYMNARKKIRTSSMACCLSERVCSCASFRRLSHFYS